MHILPLTLSLYKYNICIFYVVYVVIETCLVCLREGFADGATCCCCNTVVKKDLRAIKMV
jgi:hypothetical protein